MPGVGGIHDPGGGGITPGNPRPGGGGQVDLVEGVAFLQVMKLVEEACIHPSYQEEGVQE